MAKGFGIAALVIALMGIFVPVFTIYVAWLSLILATFSGLLGDKAFPLAATLACLINLVFLSPLTWAALAGENLSGGKLFITITIILFIAPVVALLFGAKKKQVLTRGVQL